MTARPILLLGDPQLWQPSLPVAGPALVAAPSPERRQLLGLMADLRDTLISFRRSHGSAKAIAAPQVGRLLKVIYVFEPGQPRFLVNPTLSAVGSKTVETWESCMSFPGLYVKTRRSADCTVTYLDAAGGERSESPGGELSVVLQHEFDHLDGILSLQRAVDARSFFLGSPRRLPPISNPR